MEVLFFVVIVLLLYPMARRKYLEQKIADGERQLAEAEERVTRAEQERERQLAEAEERFEKAKQETVKSAVEWVVACHLQVLIRKLRQTERTDEYGRRVTENWYRELDYFLDHVVIEKVRAEWPFPRDEAEEVCGWIADELHEFSRLSADSYVQQHMLEFANPEQQVTFDDSMAGSDFERFCADELTLAGWRVQLTGCTGDQGGDIVAEKNRHRVLVQCKKYSAPVGNAAVQEAFAGMSYHEATVACVVSNAAYTKAAQQLAATTGVHLLHYSQLSDLGTLV